MWKLNKYNQGTTTKNVWMELLLMYAKKKTEKRWIQFLVAGLYIQYYCSLAEK